MIKTKKEREKAVKEWHILNSRVLSLRDKIQVLKKRKRKLWDSIAEYDRREAQKK